LKGGGKGALYPEGNLSFRPLDASVGRKHKSTTRTKTTTHEAKTKKYS
jgi:hypothetical protein